MYTSDLFQSKSHINEDQECQVLYINDKPVAKYADPMQAKTQLAHLQSKFPAKKIELKKEMREGGQCNMTAEGQHCPAHGLAECGMWEASDPSGMMHAARHYNKSFIITAELAEGGTKKYRIHAQSERVAREKFSQHYNMAKVLSVEEEGVAEGEEENLFTSEELAAINQYLDDELSFRELKTYPGLVRKIATHFNITSIQGHSSEMNFYDRLVQARDEGDIPQQGVAEGLKQTLRKFDPTIKARIRGKSQDQTNQGLDTIQHLADLDLTSDDMVSRAMKPNTYFRNAERYAKLANKGMAEDSLNEFDPGEGGMPPFTVYVGDTLIDKFASYDEAQEEVKYQRGLDPRWAHDQWKIVNGIGETVWEYDVGEKSDDMRRQHKIQFIPRDNKDVEEGETTLTKTGRIHRSTGPYGGSPRDPDPLGDKLNKTGTKRIEKSLGVNWDRKKEWQGGVDPEAVDEVRRTNPLAQKLRDLERRQGALTKPVEQMFHVTADQHGANKDVPLYTKTYPVRANSEQEAINTISKIFGGRNHRIEQGVDESTFSDAGDVVGRKLGTIAGYALSRNKSGAVIGNKLGGAIGTTAGKWLDKKLDNTPKDEREVKQGVAEGLSQTPFTDEELVAINQYLDDDLSFQELKTYPGLIRKIATHFDITSIRGHSGEMNFYDRLVQAREEGDILQQGVAEAQNDYFKRRKDEEDRIAGTKAPAKRTPKQTDYEKKRKEQDKDIAEGGMPSSVIKSKQRYGDMSDKDFAELHQSKSDDDLVAMAWRHGYGKGSLHYVNKRKRGLARVEESRLYYNVIGTRDKDLKESFGMQQDQKGWFLEATAGRKRILEAHKAFGAPTIL